jgi:hypothetical protein
MASRGGGNCGLRIAEFGIIRVMLLPAIGLSCRARLISGKQKSHHAEATAERGGISDCSNRARDPRAEEWEPSVQVKKRKKFTRIDPINPKPEIRNSLPAFLRDLCVMLRFIFACRRLSTVASVRQGSVLLGAPLSLPLRPMLPRTDTDTDTDTDTVLVCALTEQNG